MFKEFVLKMLRRKIFVLMYHTKWSPQDISSSFGNRHFIRFKPNCLSALCCLSNFSSTAFWNMVLCWFSKIFTAEILQNKCTFLLLLFVKSRKIVKIKKVNHRPRESWKVLECSPIISIFMMVTFKIALFYADKRLALWHNRVFILHIYIIRLCFHFRIYNFWYVV